MRTPLVIALACGVCNVAHAEDYHGVVFAGGSIGDDASAYAGAVVALPGASLGDGFAAKVAVNGGRYEYAGGPGAVKADYYGGLMALAHQWNGSWGWANISAGARMTQTDLSPFDIGNERAGFRADAALGTDGALNLGESWRLSWYGEGGVRDESYLGRLETTRSMNAGQWRLGAEGIIQGDPTYRRTSAGAVGAVKFLKDFELRIALGASFQEGQDTEPYGSIGFSRLF